MKKRLLILSGLLFITLPIYLFSHTGSGSPEPIPDPEMPVVEGFKTYPGKKKIGLDQYWFCQTRLTYTDCWVLVPNPT